MNPGPRLTPSEVLARLPQQEPFRFLDEILEIDEKHVVARYRWRPEADFYRGHFPGHPVTPGVLLVEALAQAGVVALGIFLAYRELGAEEAEKLITFFTEVEVEFTGAVAPGETVQVTGRKVFFRRRKLRAEVEMRREGGELVCSGMLSGMGVPR
ncbi:MAG: 3-hydroxyacyl-ACP dehydratase FabZ family protein [Myxococcota bacterium]